MKNPPTPLTICVLTYGDHLALARRCIQSIHQFTDRSLYQLVVGANAIGSDTEDYLRTNLRTGLVDRLHFSRQNINKCPMMRRMFSAVATDYICWFDDDSHVTHPGALNRCLQIAQASDRSTVCWGKAAQCDFPRQFCDLDDVVSFVRAAPYYNGLSPPSWDPGGKGEFNLQGQGTGDGRWIFVLGGFWLIRTSAIRVLDWPDRRLVKLGDDVLLGEAIRQQGWKLANLGREFGVAIDAAPRRGHPGPINRASIVLGAGTANGQKR